MRPIKEIYFGEKINSWQQQRILHSFDKTKTTIFFNGKVVLIKEQGQNLFQLLDYKDCFKACYQDYWVVAVLRDRHQFEQYLLNWVESYCQTHTQIEKQQILCQLSIK